MTSNLQKPRISKTALQALYEIEPAIKGLMLAVQRKMDLTFPAHLVKNVVRLEIEKELIDLEETTGTIKKSLKR